MGARRGIGQGPNLQFVPLDSWGRLACRQAKQSRKISYLSEMMYGHIKVVFEKGKEEPSEISSD